MKPINYILKGFGFLNFQDFTKSSFGFLMQAKILKLDLFFAALISMVQFIFGFNHLFFVAYVVLLIFEWISGIMASQKRGEKHESRKFGRMLFKIAVYLLPIWILHWFENNMKFPEVMGFELDPFLWLYNIVLLGIIWQIFISLLENLDSLGFEFAKVLITIINKKFYKEFDLTEENKPENDGNSTP